MAFNDSGKSPWERRGNTPPNVEAFLDALQKRFRNNGQGFKPWWLVAAVLVIWLASGIFIVDPQEQAAVKRFGALVRVVGPGPNYHFPFPIETVIKERVTEVKRAEIGYRTINPGPPAQYRDVPRESLMLTGDESIVDVQFIVQYRIFDLPEYLFNVEDVEQTIRHAAESAMREVVGRTQIDSVLTEGKAEVEINTLTRLSEILANFQIGVQVENVKLQDVQPPESVADAFKAVASAREERERRINDAQGYRNDLLPRAQGEAAQIVNQARAYAAERVNIAGGEADRFNSVLAEYQKAKQVTRDRIRLETLESILPDTERIFVDPSVGRNLMPLIPLGKTSIDRAPAQQ